MPGAVDTWYPADTSCEDLDGQLAGIEAFLVEFDDECIDDIIGCIAPILVDLDQIETDCQCQGAHDEQDTGQIITGKQAEPWEGDWPVCPGKGTAPPQPGPAIGTAAPVAGPAPVMSEAEVPAEDEQVKVMRNDLGLAVPKPEEAETCPG